MLFSIKFHEEFMDGAVVHVQGLNLAKTIGDIINGVQP